MAVAEWQDVSAGAVRVINGDVMEIGDMESRRPEERRKACSWLKTVDAMFKESTGHDMVDIFSKDFTKAVSESDDATVWPRAMICPDAGSDGCAALWFAMANKPHGLGMCWETSYDTHHGSNNDCKSTLNAKGPWMDVFVWMLVHNVGYRGYDVWYAAQRQALSEYFNVVRPKTDPIFQALLPELLTALQWEHRASEDNIEEEVVEVLKASKESWNKGGKPSLVRWFGLIDKTTHVVNNALIPQFKLMYTVMLVMTGHYNNSSMATIK